MNGTVTYCGVQMVCAYDYSPAERETRIDPGQPEVAELYECKVGGIDIVDMLSAEQRDAIESLILEGRGAQAEFFACEHADRVRDERRSVA